MGIIMMDTKIFNIGGKKLRVSVMETTKPAAPLGKMQELIDAQKAIAKKDKVDDCLFLRRGHLGASCDLPSIIPYGNSYRGKGLENKDSSRRSSCLARSAFTKEADHSSVR